MARRIKIARERKGVVGAEIEFLSTFSTHSPHDPEIIFVAVVRNDYVVSAKGAKLRPHRLEWESRFDVSVGEPMFLSGARGNSNIWLHQRYELVDNFAVAYTNRR